MPRPTNNFGKCPECKRFVTLTVDEVIIDHLLSSLLPCKGSGKTPAPLDPPLPRGWRLHHRDDLGSWEYICQHGKPHPAVNDHAECEKCQQAAARKELTNAKAG